MKRSILILSVLTSVLWFLPMLASAQDDVPGLREIRELRSDDSRCPEGYRCFVAGPSASFEMMLARVNARIEDPAQHVNYEQFVDANPCGVIFHRDDGAMRHNGVCEYNHTRERVVEADFCEGHRCQRWIMASSPGHLNVYRVPAARVLTPSERAEAMVRTLDGIDPVTHTVPAPAELGGMLTELAGLMEETQPPSHDLEHQVVVAMGRALTRTPTSGTASEPTSDSAPSDMSELERLREENARLTAERDEARTAATAPAMSSDTPLWAVITLVTAFVFFLVGLFTGRRQNKAIQDYWEEKSLHSATKARVGHLENSLEIRNSEISALEKRLADAAGAKRASENSPTAGQNLEKNLSEILREVITGALKTKDGLQRQLVKLGRFQDAFIKQGLETLMNDTHNFLQVQGAWAASVPGMSFDAESIRGFAKSFEKRLDREIANAKTQTRVSVTEELETSFRTEREALATRTGTLSEELSKSKQDYAALETRTGDVTADLVRAQERITDLERELAEVQVPAPVHAPAHAVSRGILETASERLEDLYRDFFSDVLMRDKDRPTRRVVDTERVKSRFSKTIDVPYTNGSNGSRRRRAPSQETSEVRVVHELMLADLVSHLSKGYTAFDALRRYVRGALDLDMVVDFTPPPGSIPIAGLPAEAAALAEIAAPGQDSLLDHPDDTETAEIDRDALMSEPTRMVSNPLLESGAGELPREPTNPYGKPGEAASAPRRSRDDEVTKVVTTPRQTDIGIGGSALRPAPAPIATVAEDAPEASADSREDKGEVQA